MKSKDPTCIGRVRHVLGAAVTVALDADVAGVTPIYRGEIHRVGQIGSLVRIPQGVVDLIATVELVGISELSGPLQPAQVVQQDQRWLQVQLLGEVDRGTGSFQRGVGSYPGLDDPVHFATPAQLTAIFPRADSEHLRLGRLAAADNVPLCVDASRFVVRHAAVVGSTGSGKTSAVASLLQGFARGGWNAANIVVIDPHGEYRKALAETACVKSVLAPGESGLRVPFWALSAPEILQGFRVTASAPFSERYSELVTEARREFVAQSTWLDLDESAITADTPVPFDIREVWHRLDCENNETLEDGSPSVLDAGHAATLRSTRYKPYGPGNTPPNKGPRYGWYGTSPDQLRRGLRDPQLRFFRGPEGTLHGDDPLVRIVQDWLGGDSPVSVLDFSGVPNVAADLAVGLVLSLIFEVAVRTGTDTKGIGRPRPVLVVLEEAHRFLGSGASSLTRNSANRIAREGRKYGVGLLLVTQRPSELPDTALAQCGTILALRLSNSEDQGTIRAALPDMWS
ncbi:MAG: ATP-binding protein [Chloroflexota bacterium]|nr:ATP-binding protein [Chloroflexota bacterium]